MNIVEIYCENSRSYVKLQGGETLAEAAKRVQLDFEPVCARVNNKTEGMHFCVYHPKTVEFLPATSPSGGRAYVRSLCMLLYRAVSRVAPDANLNIQHSIARGYYCTLNDASGYMPVTPRLLAEVNAEMRRLVDADLPFEPCEDRTEEVVRIFERQGLHDKVLLLRTMREPYTVYYRLDGICDSYYGTLVPRTGMLRTFDLRPYKKGFLLLTTDATTAEPTETQEKMYKAFTEYVDFNHILGVRNAGELNRLVLKKRTSDLINVAEALHNKYISQIADEITRRYHAGGARIVLIAGPSSSGKTTTTKRLAIQLMANLLKPQMISLDDYFVDRHTTPLDEHGDYDYESLYALDLKQFNADLNAILRGEEVELPTYNFERGMREYRGNRIKLENRGILLIEGIHGLNPELTEHIAEDMKFRVYVSALTTLTIDSHNWVPTTDNRLLRRIIRDYKYRGISAEESIRRWPSVRRGEERWIFPYQENADATFNSSLLFELSVIREEAERCLRDVKSDVPEYGEAYRLRRFLEHFEPIAMEAIPPTSLLREFVGGSSFHY
ncbi:MAG: nucleoside kinase [Muribaculaceae bacterium]|nr:nucleoside kinase [Muribaculaceae bacterium]MDE6486345.1 nucleoside kinase [Muribaculaceae bacterium]